MMQFPLTRLRRLRMNAILRDLAAETCIRKEKLIQPHFVVEGSGQEQEIPTLPQIRRCSLDRLLNEVETDLQLGIRSHILFGVPEHKDDLGSTAYGEESLIVEAVKKLKETFGKDLNLITDLCLCAYTTHGHCGVVTPEGIIDNDRTNEVLARAAASYAAAGADIIAPSDMMDGRVLAIRRALDATGFAQTPIMSYTAKYASSFYGPFRDAAHSAPSFGDRKSHQMDYRNSREAVLEAVLDAGEGADIIMVKPALPYLDVIAAVRAAVRQPVAAYQVSGEYACVHFAARAGAAELHAMAIETLTAITRAGAEIILSYFTRQLHAEHWV